jgi:hypothetical protein
LIPVIGETDEVPAAAIKTADVLFADAEDRCIRSSYR